MRKRARKEYVLGILKEKSSVSVAALSHAFSLSEVSVRRILDEMEREGLIRRTWGGAVSARGSLGEPSYAEKADQNAREKRAIAEAAYRLISDGDAVFLDSGTTTVHLAELLAAGQKRKVMVCTNALSVALAFDKADDMQVILIGGEFRPRILSCTGSLAQETLSMLFFDKGFLTGNHFSVEHGFTTPSLQDADVKRAVVASSKETYMLIDFSKFGNDSLALIAGTGRIGTLVTDSRMPADVAKQFTKEGMRVVMAEIAEEASVAAEA